MRKRLLTLGFVSVFACAASVAAPAPGGKKPPAATVNTTRVTAQSWAPSLTLDGALRAYEGAVVKTQVAGTITEILFRSGETVHKGDPLVQIYPNILEAKLKAAIANYNLAIASYQRQVALYRKRSTAKADLDKAKANMLALQAQVVVAKAELDQTLVKAPFSGRLGVRFINTGEYVKVGQPLVNIQNTSTIFADFSVPQTYLSSIDIGRKVNVSINAYPKDSFTGVVTAIGTKVDQDTRAILVRATLPANPKLIPGTFVAIKLDLATPKTVLRVPLTSVIYTQNQDYVYRVENGKAVRTKVSLGQRDSSSVIVTSGLQENQCIVTDGSNKLKGNSAAIKIESGCSSD